MTMLPPKSQGPLNNNKKPQQLLSCCSRLYARLPKHYRVLLLSLLSFIEVGVAMVKEDIMHFRHMTQGPLN